MWGGSSPKKGAAKLAEAVRQLNQNGTSCALFIAGTGPEENALRQLGAPIYALGALPHPQIVQLLTQASCYCLPTEYAEGFPTTLLEAAACRCPIVTTHTAGTSELLPDGTYAAYLESTAPAALAAALQAVLADPDAARTRADAAYTNLCAHFTWQAVFATMEKTAAQAAKRELRCQNYSSSSPLIMRKKASFPWSRN